MLGMDYGGQRFWQRSISGNTCTRLSLSLTPSLSLSSCPPPSLSLPSSLPLSLPPSLPPSLPTYRPSHSDQGGSRLLQRAILGISGRRGGRLRVKKSTPVTSSSQKRAATVVVKRSTSRDGEKLHMHVGVYIV